MCVPVCVPACVCACVGDSVCILVVNDDYLSVIICMARSD